MPVYSPGPTIQLRLLHWKYCSTKWSRRKEFNFRLLVRSEVPYTLDDACKMVGVRNPDIRTSGSQNQCSSFELHPAECQRRRNRTCLVQFPKLVPHADRLGAESWCRLPVLTRILRFFRPAQCTALAQSANLVETEGVEPSTSECKTDVFPLAPRPRIVLLQSRYPATRRPPPEGSEWASNPRLRDLGWLEGLEPS